MSQFPGFIGGLGRAQSVNVNSERLINWYLEGVDSPTGRQPSPVVLMPSPGLSVFASGLDGPVRGIFSQDGRVFAAANSLYELDGVGTATLRGALAFDGQPVSMVSNGHGGGQLLIISAGSGYIFDLTANTLTQITSSGFPSGAVMADFIGGYFVVLQASTSKFFASALFNGLVWDGTDVGQLTNASDNLVALRVLNNNLWLMGTSATEPWYNAGATFPFAPIPNALIEQGTGAPWSVAELNGSLLMVVDDEHGRGLVVESSGYGLNRISTHAVEYRLSQVSDLYEARGFAYQELGHWFYVLTFPSAAGVTSLVYDKTNGSWHERGVWNAGTGTYDPLWAQCHAHGFGRHLVGSRRDGTVYEMSTAIVTDAGTPIRRQRTCPHLNAEHQWVYYHQLEVELEAGLGTNVSPGDDPVIQARWSDDGGHVFGPWRTTSGGRVGQYRRRAVFQMLGRSRDRVFEVATSGEIPWRLVTANLRVSNGLESS